MKTLAESLGIRYGILEREDFDEAARLLADVFSRFDPLALAVGFSALQIENLVRVLEPAAVSDGLTIIARAESGQLAGVMLSNDFAVPPPPDAETVSPQFAPIGALLESLDDQYRRTNAIIPGSHLHLLMVGVLPSFGGRGIARAMIRLSLENGRKRGYRVAVTEATGQVSQGIFRKLGFKDLFMTSYKEFLYEGKRVFASIGVPEGTLLMEKNIDEQLTNELQGQSAA